MLFGSRTKKGDSQSIDVTDNTPDSEGISCHKHRT
jgi:hypothetical protein